MIQLEHGNNVKYKGAVLLKFIKIVIYFILFFNKIRINIMNFFLIIFKTILLIIFNNKVKAFKAQFENAFFFGIFE